MNCKLFGLILFVAFTLTACGNPEQERAIAEHSCPAGAFADIGEPSPATGKIEVRCRKKGAEGWHPYGSHAIYSPSGETLMTVSHGIDGKVVGDYHFYDSTLDQAYWFFRDYLKTGLYQSPGTFHTILSCGGMRHCKENTGVDFRHNNAVDCAVFHTPCQEKHNCAKGYEMKVEDVKDRSESHLTTKNLRRSYCVNKEGKKDGAEVLYDAKTMNAIEAELWSDGLRAHVWMYFALVENNEVHGYSGYCNGNRHVDNDVSQAFMNMPCRATETND